MAEYNVAFAAATSFIGMRFTHVR